MDETLSYYENNICTDSQWLRRRRTFESNSTVWCTSDTETEYFQYFSGHRIFFQFFRSHSSTDSRYVQLVQFGPTKRNWWYFFRGKFQFAQKLSGSTVDMQHLFYNFHTIRVLVLNVSNNNSYLYVYTQRRTVDHSVHCSRK